MSTPKEELESLIDSLLPLVQSMLVEHGTYVPFGGYLSEDDQITPIGASTQSANPTPEELIGVLRLGLQQRRDASPTKGTAIVYNVHTTPPAKSVPQDCILFELEHREGFQVYVLFPFHLNGPELELEPPFAVKDFITG